MFTRSYVNPEKVLYSIYKTILKIARENKTSQLIEIE